MGKYCVKCGKEQPTDRQKYNLCLQCYKENKKELQEDGGFDLRKKIEVEAWVLIAIFILGGILTKWLLG